MVTSGWKDLDEKKVMEISRRGFEMMEESEILMPHPLKRYLRGWVCYKLVSEWETTLGLLGLTKESSDYFSFLENFKGEGTLPYPI
jgi:hypothetical protein